MVKVDAEIDAIKARLIEQTSAREQSEAVCDRQGERITNLQATVADLEAKLTEQSEIAATLKRERDEYRAQLPTKEDEDALAELTSLLTTKRIPTSLKANSSQSQTTLRISENRAEAA